MIWDTVAGQSKRAGPCYNALDRSDMPMSCLDRGQSLAALVPIVARLAIGMR